MSNTQTNGHKSGEAGTVPMRLHHAAYVCRDLEADAEVLRRPAGMADGGRLA